MARDGIIRIDRHASELDDMAESLSDAREMLWEADRRVREAEAARRELVAWLSSANNGVFCDHPETSGRECECCHAYVPMDDDQLAETDFWNVRTADDYDARKAGLVLA